MRLLERGQRLLLSGVRIGAPKNVGVRVVWGLKIIRGVYPLRNIGAVPPDQGKF